MLRSSFWNQKIPRISHSIELALSIKNRSLWAAVIEHLTEKWLSTFSELLDSFKELIANTPKKQLPSEWTEFWQRCLGWASEEKERSVNYPDLSQLDNILAWFSWLPFFSKPATANTGCTIPIRWCIRKDSDHGHSGSIDLLLMVSGSVAWPKSISSTSRNSNLLPILQNKLGLNSIIWTSKEHSRSFSTMENQALDLVLSIHSPLTAEKCPSLCSIGPKMRGSRFKTVNPLWKDFTSKQITLETIPIPWPSLLGYYRARWKAYSRLRLYALNGLLCIASVQTSHCSSIRAVSNTTWKFGSLVAWKLLESST